MLITILSTSNSDTRILEIIFVFSKRTEHEKKKRKTTKNINKLK
jgi:hypothetical protein